MQMVGADVYNMDISTTSLGPRHMHGCFTDQQGPAPDKTSASCHLAAFTKLPQCIWDNPIWTSQA